jgi:hypothetical protein
MAAGSASTTSAVLTSHALKSTPSAPRPVDANETIRPGVQTARSGHHPGHMDVPRRRQVASARQKSHFLLCARGSWQEPDPSLYLRRGKEPDPSHQIRQARFDFRRLCH